MSEAQTVYRVDKFIVPKESRDEFMARISHTHQLLRSQPGFVKDSILEQVGGPGKYNVVTIAEWQNQEAIDAAKSKVQAEHIKNGFSPQHTMERLGIQADIANYTDVSDVL